MKQFLNWKTTLIVVALCIVAATLYYTNQLASRLAGEEQKKVELVVGALRTLTRSEGSADIDFPMRVLESNSTIPFIIAGPGDTVYDVQNSVKNLDFRGVTDTAAFVQEKLREFKRLHTPIVSDFGTGKNNIYYGESYVLTQLRYFPYVQMTIILLFLLVVVIAIRAAYRSMQNQVWLGLSKETAHQLGTPLTSITGWLELLRDHEPNLEAVVEMEKDLSRLKLVADRFSKVGSAPQLEVENLVTRLEDMADYMQRRAPSRVTIGFETNEPDVPVLLSGPLFDWVVENLVRNALDAMDGRGEIHIRLRNTQFEAIVDVQDTGKGIPRHLIKKVFRPGFTTKKRGWGLGLSLARRIMTEYHHGGLYVAESEAGKGTTFRIVFRR